MSKRITLTDLEIKLIVELVGNEQKRTSAFEAAVLRSVGDKVANDLLKRLS